PRLSPKWPRSARGRVDRLPGTARPQGMDPPTPLAGFTADHRYLLQRVAGAAGFADPVAIDLDEFAEPLLKRARRGPILPVDGVLVRDWDPDDRKTSPGVQLGLRLYEVEGVRFAQVAFMHDDRSCWGFHFTAVDKA